MKIHALFVVLLAMPVFGGTPPSSQPASSLNTFTAGDLISASKMNENFSYLNDRFSLDIQQLQSDVQRANNAAMAAQEEAARANARIDNMAFSVNSMSIEAHYKLALVDQGQIINSPSPLNICNCASDLATQFVDHNFGAATLPAKVETEITIGVKNELGWSINTSTKVLISYTDYCVETTIDKTSVDSSFTPSLWLDNAAQSALNQINIE